MSSKLQYGSYAFCSAEKKTEYTQKSYHLSSALKTRDETQYIVLRHT